MITLPNLQFTSDISLTSVMATMTKAGMLSICTKLNLYVSPNLKKEETARRVASELLNNPEEILCSLSKEEYKILDEFVQAGPNHYVIRKMRKTPYKLQKYGLVVTYEDGARQQWHLLMPDCIREALAPYYKPYFEMVMSGTKIPSAKELRMASVMRDFFGESKEGERI